MTRETPYESAKVETFRNISHIKAVCLFSAQKKGFTITLRIITCSRNPDTMATIKRMEKCSVVTGGDFKKMQQFLSLSKQNDAFETCHHNTLKEKRISKY